MGSYSSHPRGLSEAAASKLVRAWVGDCDVSPNDPRGKRGELAHPSMVVTIRPCAQLDQTRASALAHRRAMEALNALAWCRGCTNDENPGFWRRIMLFPAGVDSTQWTLDDELFARHRVVVRDSEDAESIAVACAACLTMDAASEAMAIRQEIHADLRSYLVREPPMLQLQLTFHANDWQVIKNSLFDLNRLWRVDQARVAQERVVVHFDSIYSSDTCVRAGTGCLRTISELVTLPCVAVEVLHVHIGHSAVVLDALAIELYALMCELMCVDTERSLSWHFKTFSARCVSAICSSLPAMKSATSFSLVIDNLEASPGQTAQREYGRWLAYAVANREYRAKALSLEFRATQDTVGAFQEALESTNCLAEAASQIGMPENGRNGVLLAHGSTASLRKNAVVTAAGDRSFLAVKDTRVNVIAQCGSSAFLVRAGFGLVSVDISNLSDWRNTVPQVHQRSAFRREPLVETLVCSESNPVVVARLMRHIGSGLATLSLCACPVIEEAELDSIMKRCPILETFAVVNGSVSRIEPLLQVYRSGCKVSTLILDPREAGRPDVGATLTELFACLRDPYHPIANVLSRLVLKPTVLSNSDVRKLDQCLQSNRRLEYVRWTIDNDFDVGDFAMRRLAHVEADPMMQTSKSKLAFYTYLLAARRRYVQREVPVECNQRIAEFAAIPSIRFVEWDCLNP